MGLGLTLTQFTSNTTISSSAVNGNFSAINTLSSLPIPFLTFSSDSGSIQSDGIGNLLWAGGLGKNTYTDILNSGGNTTIFNDFSGLNGLQFTINGTNVGFARSALGWFIPNGKTMSFLTGSLSRLSIFTGTGAGTFSHGLGATPTWVLPMQNAGANNNSIGIDTLTSTTVHIDVNNNPSWWALAMAQ